MNSTTQKYCSTQLSLEWSYFTCKDFIRLYVAIVRYSFLKVWVNLPCFEFGDSERVKIVPCNHSINPLFQVVVLLLLRLSQLWAFPNGAPLSTCETMGPHHGDNKAQSGASPYDISVSKSSYTTGENLTVTISGSKTFKGFILQAQGSDSSVAWPVGVFTQVPDGSLNFKLWA